MTFGIDYYLPRFFGCVRRAAAHADAGVTAAASPRWQRAATRRRHATGDRARACLAATQA
jgi:hypothetical protein